VIRAGTINLKKEKININAKHEYGEWVSVRKHFYTAYNLVTKEPTVIVIISPGEDSLSRLQLYRKV
jgi:hypothetical protein